MTVAEIRYCPQCGRQMVPVVDADADPYDGATGAPVSEVALYCPRFGRSWQNLWFGGWRHYGYKAVEGGINLEIVWR